MIDLPLQTAAETGRWPLSSRCASSSVSTARSHIGQGAQLVQRGDSRHSDPGSGSDLPNPSAYLSIASFARAAGARRAPHLKGHSGVEPPPGIRPCSENASAGRRGRLDRIDDALNRLTGGRVPQPLVNRSTPLVGLNVTPASDVGSRRFLRAGGLRARTARPTIRSPSRPLETARLG